MKSGLYKHFKGGVYSVLGDAVYLPAGVSVVLIDGAIAKHESSDAEANLYYDADGNLYITSVKSSDEEMLKQGKWRIYISVSTGVIWFRPPIDFDDQKGDVKRFERIGG